MECSRPRLTGGRERLPALYNNAGNIASGIHRPRRCAAFGRQKSRNLRKFRVVIEFLMAFGYNSMVTIPNYAL